jgi:unsaturated rhamnogalacturonyl hydrolase
VIDRFIRHYVEGYHSYKNGRWCYEDGCFYKGLADLHAAGQGDWLLAALIDHVNRRVKPDGTIDGYAMDAFSLDNVQAGRVLFRLRDETGDPRYAKALHVLREQLRLHPRTRANNFWHKKVYPWQVWLDGLYMALPLLAAYSLDYEEGAALPDVRGQIETVRRLMYDPRTGLYHHGYDESRSAGWADPETGLSASFWSRAIGWYAMALADLVEIVPAGHADRAFYAGLLREVGDAVLAWRQPDGLWMQVMDQPDRPGNYPESSCTAMFAYAFLKGHRLGVLDAATADGARGSLDGLVDRYLKGPINGTALGGICLMAGLGDINGEFGYRDGSFAYYVGEPVVENDPKGVGPFMMAEAERRRLG